MCVYNIWERASSSLFLLLGACDLLLLHRENKNYALIFHFKNIFNIWFFLCVLFTHQVFDEPETFRKMEREGTNFQDLHLHLVEFMQAVTLDPRVTTMLQKTRGDRLWRQHQGEKLIELLTEWIQKEVCFHVDIFNS